MKYIIILISVLCILWLVWYVYIFPSYEVSHRLQNTKDQFTSLTSWTNTLYTWSNTLTQANITGWQNSAIASSGWINIVATWWVIWQPTQPQNTAQDQKTPYTSGVVDGQILIEPDPEFEDIRGLVDDLLE